jgi:hypothetical protein
MIDWSKDFLQKKWNFQQKDHYFQVKKNFKMCCSVMREKVETLKPYILIFTFLWKLFVVAKVFLF